MYTFTNSSAASRVGSAICIWIGALPAMQQVAGGGAQRLHRFAPVFALQPLRIGADRLDDQIAPHAVASGDLHRQAGERHQRRP